MNGRAEVELSRDSGDFRPARKDEYLFRSGDIPIIPDGGAIILTASVAGANGGLGGSTEGRTRLKQSETRHRDTLIFNILIRGG